MGLDPLDELAADKIKLTRGGRTIESRGAPEKPSSGEASMVQEIMAFLPPGVKAPKNLADTSEWQAAFSKWEESVKQRLADRKKREREEAIAMRWKPRRQPEPISKQ